MRYKHLVIDPPWKQRKTGGDRLIAKGRAFDYPTMSVPDIFSLLDREVFPIAADQHNVFLWLIDKYLHEGEAAMEERGYKRHARFIWDKTNGVSPAFTVRYSHEYLTWFYKPKLLTIDPSQRGKQTTVIREPSRQHSRKPDAAYALIDSLYPTGKRIDVFSREKRKGWDQWGNDVTHFQCA